MESLKDLLPEARIIEKAEKTLLFKERWLNRGFTMVSNRLIRNTEVSAMGRLLYVLLMSRVFQKDFCFPGRETLAKEIGLSVPQTDRYLGELEDMKWLQIKRRGLGKTNLYFLLKK